MVQQIISIFSVAYKGDGIGICKNPEILKNLVVGKLSNNPWIIYWAQWLDPWLMSDSYVSPILTDPKVKLNIISEDVFRLTPSKTSIQGLRNSLKSKFQWEENRIYNWQLLQACTLQENFLRSRRVFVIRKTLDVSLEDSTLLSLLQ